MQLRNLIIYSKQTLNEWSNDKISVWSAALAYYTVFSLSPLLLVVIGVAGYVFGADVVQANIFQELKGLVGNQGAAFIQTMIQNAAKPGNGILATILGLITLILGASGVFGQLKETLNYIWKVETKPGAGITHIVRERVLNFSMVLVIAFLLLVSLILSAVITGLTAFFNHILPVSGVVLESLNFIVSFAIVTILFMLLFKTLPDIKLHWKDIFVGGLFTAFLFVIGKTALGIYIGGKSFSSTYGAAASVVVLLVWVYYTSQIIFLGAEFTKVYVGNTRGSVIPDNYALIKKPLPGKKHKDPAEESVIDAAVRGYLEERKKQQQKSKQKKTPKKKD